MFISSVDVMLQAFGCVASMFLISPKLTGLMAVVVTAVVTVGSLFGSVLRQLSRTSQAQVLCVHCIIDNDDASDTVDGDASLILSHF